MRAFVVIILACVRGMRVRVCVRVCGGGAGVPEGHTVKVIPCVRPAVYPVPTCSCICEELCNDKLETAARMIG